MWRQFSDDNDSGDIMSDFCSTFTNFIINFYRNYIILVKHGSVAILQHTSLPPCG